MLFEIEIDDENLTGDKSDSYILKDLQQLKDTIMAGMFNQIRFRKNLKYMYRVSRSSNMG